MQRTLVFLYGSISYVVFLVTFLYSIGFVGNLVVPKSIDTGTVESAGFSITVNVLLLALFAVQHTIMARPGFKSKWIEVVHPAIERSTFVLLASLCLVLMMWQWRPLPDVVWDVQGGVVGALLWAAFFAGWAIVLVSTYLIDHFDLFGLRQVLFHFRGRPYEPPRFVERFLYRHVRHPLMLGFLVAFWFTPTMSQGHLLFSIVTTVYILVAVRIEEGDLMRAHGDDYADYRRRVSMLLPLRSRK